MDCSIFPSLSFSVTLHFKTGICDCHFVFVFTFLFSPQRRFVLQTEISGKYITEHVFLFHLSQFKSLNLLAVRISLLLLGGRLGSISAALSSPVFVPPREGEEEGGGGNRA